MIKTIRISGKTSDMFTAVFMDDKDAWIFDYQGYVPEFFPGKHYGDYIMLDIDIETGKIMNWTATQEQIQAFVDEHLQPED